MKKLNKVLVTTALVAGSLSPVAVFAATTNSTSDTLTNSLSNVSNTLSDTANNLPGSINSATKNMSGSMNNAANNISGSMNNGSNTGTLANNSGSNGSSLIPMDGTNHNYSTYNLTHSGFNGTVTPVSLIPVANKSFDGINQSVQDAAGSMQPIHLTLSTNKLGTMGYSSGKIKVAGSPANVQLWAKNTDGNWVNVADTGWGPVAGFRLDPQYNQSVDLYLMNSGSYTPVKLQLIDMKNPDKILAEDDLTYIMPK